MNASVESQNKKQHFFNVELFTVIREKIKQVYDTTSIIYNQVGEEGLRDKNTS